MTVLKAALLRAVTWSIAGCCLFLAVCSVAAAPPPPIYPNPPHLSTNSAADANLYWSPGDQELIVNGGFETGNFNGWVRANVGGDTFINNGNYDPNSPDGPLPPLAGSFSTITDQMAPGTHTLSQDISIPLEATSAILSWSDRIRNHAGTFANDGQLQRFKVEIRDTNNTPLTLIFSTEPGDIPLANWVKRNADLSSFRGQRIRVVFTADQNLFFFNVHLDNISVLAKTRASTFYDVYFGTNSVPGTNEFLGSATNTTWGLPLLQPFTTYFWRVIARQGDEQTIGPVWRFSTRGRGPMDHFTWSAVASPQQSGQPFTVSITARDAGNNVVTSFNNMVALSGATAIDVAPHQLLSDQTYSAFASYDRATVGYSFTPSSDILVIGVRHFSGEKISLWTDDGVLLASQMVNSLVGSWRATPLANPLPLYAGKTYRLGVYNSGLVTNFARFDLPASFNHGIIHQSYDGVGDNFPTNEHPARWWFVDLIYAMGLRESLAVSPILASNFVDGVWAGNLTIETAARDVFLRAEDMAGHVGLSPGFSVLPRDTDGDGMPDEWELAHGLDPNAAADALNDRDADGSTNLQEYLAGTDPRDPASVVRITKLNLNQAGVLIYFTTIAGKSYQLERTDNLPGNIWNVVLSNLQGNGAIAQATDVTAGQSQQFYRIRVLR